MSANSITLTDCKIWLGPYDLSGQHNAINLDYGPELLDETVFGGSGTRRYKPGLKTVKASGNIFWDDVTDAVLYDRIGADREVFAIAPQGNTEGQTFFFTRAVSGTYDPISGEVGQLLKATLDTQPANTPLVRGVLSAPKVVGRSATGNSTGFVLGATPSDAKLYAGLFVFDVTTPGTLDVIVESDTVGFPSPTTRLTFSQVTATPVAQWQEIAGPITDTYLRTKWTIAGGGVFTFAVVTGILVNS
jgi:hypothetical protein